MAQLNYSDFYQVPELKFDIAKLREDLDAILKKKVSLLQKEFLTLEQFH